MVRSSPSPLGRKRERELIGWARAEEWLQTISSEQVVTREEIERWMEISAADLAPEISEATADHVVGYLQSQHRLILAGATTKDEVGATSRRDEVGATTRRRDEVGATTRSRDEVGASTRDENGDRSWVGGSSKGKGSKPVSHKWKPVYDWLKSMGKRDLVKSKEIFEWLDKHPETAAAVDVEKKRQFVVSYIQKTHHRLLDTKSNERRLGSISVDGEASPIPGAMDDGSAGRAILKTYSLRGNVKGRRGVSASQEHERNEEGNGVVVDTRAIAARKLELLDELQTRLRAIIRRLKAEDSGSEASDEEEGRIGMTPMGAAGRPVRAWGCSEANPVLPDKKGSNAMERATILRCVQAREMGANFTGAHYPVRTGRVGWNWKSFVQGWDSRRCRRVGVGSYLRQRDFSSWCATWCAYTSSGAVVLPLQRVEQAVQKVLDVRFHPGGRPQLVCSCNEAPHELLLYDLSTGRATELEGHNSQIQTVEFAFGGERIVSCATNLVKVWDPHTGKCLHTMGPRPGDAASPEHHDKILALAVAPDNSCIVATSGGPGDDKLLLWNVLSGDLVAHLNATELVGPGQDAPSMDAIGFCGQNTLICGSDNKKKEKPAIVQVWDVTTLKRDKSFPAHDAFITTVGTSPDGRTIISGSGDGTVGLFDLRSGRGIARLSVGDEVTSASFCCSGTFFQASCTGNTSTVWDTRFMPFSPGPEPNGGPLPAVRSSSRNSRALHRLSHGKPMPSIDNAGQYYGYVDVGDQGVNDTKWFHNDDVLVTASGNGSISVWDVSLGKPCVKQFKDHSRCINTVAISKDDKYICSGGDDQKVVLYEDARDPTLCKWRLTRPLCEDVELAWKADQH